ncbi:MAG TPA: aminotransferase class I/II-fold pyridoxal phosphate-dependent enzyme [Solirubrobacteraceae bacterium]|jgi:DNA-binding transcriptional MocR family regulator|nr:aminotransferase class I/II-fold pyridoxal phosphate-dependent enzyme [Solirubrobacteraceae bacterium]
MPDLKQYRIAAASAAELVRCIEAGVADGELAPGEKLPSVRRLAGDVGLSPVTVAAALSELRRRGVVVTEPRRGTRIGLGPPIGSLRAPLPVPAGARDFSRGNPDPALLPDIAAALARLRAPGRLYGEVPILPELERLARERLAADGIPAGSVCVVSGALDGIERVLQAHLRPGDRVAVESPGYAALYDLLRALGLALEPVALDERGMLPDALAAALARGAAAVVLTPRGQNPTGAALDAGRAAELRGVLGEHPRTLLVEDDHLGEVAGCELHSAVEGRSRWAATRSVAKALGPDIRLAVLAGDEHTLARVQGRQQCGPGWVSHILQSLVVELWSERGHAALLAAASAAYAARREGLLGRLAERGVGAHGRSGLNVWVPVADEAGVMGALLARGWVVAPGAPYRLGGEPTAVRVTIATLDEGAAERLAGDLAEVTAPRVWARSG